MSPEFEFTGPYRLLKLPVRIWGMDASGHPFSQSATTDTLSSTEASIAGVSVSVKIDDIVGLSYEGRKGRFRVIAIGSATTPAHVMLRSIEPSQNLWGIDFTQRLKIEKADYGERRSVSRYHCKAAISMWQDTSPHPIHAGVSDLSLNGCYVDLTFPLAVGSKVSVGLNISGVVIRATGEVCTSHPAVGMGLRFESMPEADRATLEKVVAGLAAAAEAAPEASAE